MGVIGLLLSLVWASLVIWAVERRDRIGRYLVYSKAFMAKHPNTGVPFGVRYRLWQIEDRVWRLIGLPYPQGEGDAPPPQSDKPCGCGEE